jgi:hypothetical protein
VQGAGVVISRRPPEDRQGSFDSAEPWQAEMDDRLAAFARATSEQQRRLGNALADALSAVAHRVDRIEHAPDRADALTTELAQLTSAFDAAARRADVVSVERAVGRIAARQAEQDEALRRELQNLGRKLDALAETRLPARLDAMADRLAAAATRLKDTTAAEERPEEVAKRLERIEQALSALAPAVERPRLHEGLETVKAELDALRAAQAIAESRLQEALARIETALSRPGAAPPTGVSLHRNVAPGAVRRSLIAAARRAIEGRRGASAEPAYPAPLDENGIDLRRPFPPQRQGGLGVLAVSAAVLAGLLYLAKPSAPAPEIAAAAGTASNLADVLEPSGSRVAPAAALPETLPQTPNPAPGAFNAADHAALEEFASRLLRGDEIARDRAIEKPQPAPAPITENSPS